MSFSNFWGTPKRILYRVLIRTSIRSSFQRQRTMRSWWGQIVWLVGVWWIHGSYGVDSDGNDDDDGGVVVDYLLGGGDCDVREGDDVRLFGSGADAGRLELCWDSKWRYVCIDDNDSSSQLLTSGQALDWPLEMAVVACRHLGFARPFLAKRASDMAMGETIQSGVSSDIAGISLQHCTGDESTLYQCQIQLDSTCTIHRALGAACATSLETINNNNNNNNNEQSSEVETLVQQQVQDLTNWYKVEQNSIHQLEKSATQLSSTNESQKPSCEDSSVVTTTKSTTIIDNDSTVPTIQRLKEWNIPIPFHDQHALDEAFLFANDVSQSYHDIQHIFEQQHELSIISDNNSNTTLLELVQSIVPWVEFNAYGLNLKNYVDSVLGKNKSLSNVANLLKTSKKLKALKMVYLSSNKHNALHWYLDTPYRYYQPSLENEFKGDMVAYNLFQTLQRDGFVSIDDFGGDIEGIWNIVAPTLTKQAAIKYKNETSISGAGSIITSRIPIPPLEDILVRNTTIASVIQAYLGHPSILHGYKTTKITNSLSKVDQYNAALYHHDRVGRRIKAFVFLHDVDCQRGHPTKIATGTQNILFYKTENYPSTRFVDNFVESNYNIRQGCGKKGGGFLFDPHTIHKGSIHGDQERTVIIAEYHHAARCPYSQQNYLGLPCPAGDLYRIDTHLSP